MKDFLKFLQTYYFPQLTEADMVTIENHYMETQPEDCYHCDHKAKPATDEPCLSCDMNCSNFSKTIPDLTNILHE